MILQNCDILEFLQPEEEPLENDELLLGLDNKRWITADEKDAGAEGETVLFRTFINAAIGSRRSRIWSRGAAYMLILFTLDGESEPKVTICNQSGTLSLSQDCELSFDFGMRTWLRDDRYSHH